MIVYDTPRMVEFRGRSRRSAHLMSTLLGDEGTRELDAFATSIGMKVAWRQRTGEPSEHYDLFDSKIDQAFTAGATCVDPRTLVRMCIRPKRQAGKP